MKKPFIMVKNQIIHPKTKLIDIKESKFNSKGKDQIKSYNIGGFCCISPSPISLNFLKAYSHNHLENKSEAAKSLVKNKINDEISNVIRSRRKQLPPDITTFDEIPNESKKKNTIKQKRDKIFMIFKKNHNLIVFQFPFHTELFSKNKHTFFMDAISNAVEKKLQEEESKYYNDYKRRTAEIFLKKINAD
ncbi:hypothetical protein U3516DRAFT_746343 [Neocallimastix sp. 'constans']